MAGPEVVIGVVVLAYWTALIWSLYAILTTPRETWRRSGMSRLLWLAAVIVMPLIGSVLFVTVARPRLAGRAEPRSRLAETPSR